MNNSILIRWDTFHINHRLLREERVGRRSGHQIDCEADDGPVSGVLDLRDILQLIVDGLDQSPLAQENFVRDCHKLAFHVALKLCYLLDAVHEKSGEEVPADVSLVSDQISEDPFDEGFVPERIPVVNIARCVHEVQESSPPHTHTTPRHFVRYTQQSRLNQNERIGSDEKNNYLSAWNK